MGLMLLWLPLMLMIYMEQAQANHKPHDEPLKPDNGSAIGKSVYSVDLKTIFQDKLCKCRVNGRWKEENPCLCAKLSKRKNRRVDWRKLCLGMNTKHIKKCRFFKKKHRNYGPILPM